MILVETRFDNQKDGEDISVKFNGKIVFSATRFDEAGYSSAFWPVDPTKNKEDYLKRLIAFYQAFKTSGFEEKKRSVFPYGIMLDEITENPLPLEYLDGDQPKILQHPNWKDFAIFRVDSPYAAFTMEDYSKDGWKPETGMISVITHNDLSVLVSELIAKTAKYPAPAEQLQPILAEEIYTFKREVLPLPKKKGAVPGFSA